MTNEPQDSDEPQKADCPSAPCSSSEFACQYWREGKGWCESSIYATEAEAVCAHKRIQKAFPECRYRVVERVSTERIICETNTKITDA